MTWQSVGVLGHYGGVDEIGIFVLPVLVVLLIMRRVERKARQRNERLADGEGEVDGRLADS